MIKKIKGLVSICLVVSLTVLCGFSNIAQAQNKNIIHVNGQDVEILKDNGQVRQTRVVENGITTDSTYSKKDNSMTIETYEMVNGEKINLKTFLINLNGIDNKVLENKSSVTTLSTRLGYQNTFSNYEYTFYSGDMWELRRPDGSLNGTYYFRTYKVQDTNGNDIDKFRTKVNLINTLEGKLIGASSMAVLTAVLSLIFTVITAGASSTGAYAALGLNTAAIYFAIELEEACVNANYYYWQVYNKSRIFF